MAGNIKGRVGAVLAGSSVLGVGLIFTLASWADAEWAFGGDGAGGPGLGTSEFDIQQDRSQPYNAASPTYEDFETAPGGALVFGLTALDLVPGETVYAPIALRTTADSVAGTLQLNSAVAASGVTISDPSGYLWSSLSLEVGYVIEADGDQPATCDAAGFASFAPLTLTGSGLGATPAAATQPIQGASADVVHYCFAITMPDVGAPLPAGVASVNDLQGRTVAPAWRFDATSS